MTSLLSRHHNADMASDALAEAGRLLETVCPDLAFRVDEIRAEVVAKARALEAQIEAAAARHDAECAEYETTTGRDFDRWAQKASVGEIEQRMGVL